MIKVKRGFNTVSEYPLLKDLSFDLTQDFSLMFNHIVIVYYEGSLEEVIGFQTSFNDEMYQASIRELETYLKEKQGENWKELYHYTVLKPLPV